MDDVRAWLEELRGAGVKVIPVDDVLARFDGEEDESDDESDPIAALVKGVPRPKQRKLLRYLIHRLKPEIVGTQEAAELLGVEKARLTKWRSQGDASPLPPTIGVCPRNTNEKSTGYLVHPASGPVWLAEDFSELAAEVERRRRRPKG